MSEHPGAGVDPELDAALADDWDDEPDDDEEGEVVELSTGDSWTVPRGATHTYKILEPFTAVEATSPPAEERNRDEP